MTVEDATYQRYLEKTITLTPEQTHYDLELTIPADMLADIKFQLGNLDGASAAAHTVMLRNIQWKS